MKPFIKLDARKKILLTGATGYIGGRLLRKLQNAAYSVRCLSRHPEYLIHETNSSTEVIQGDVLDINSLELALKDIDTSFYLIHALGSEKKFEEEEIPR